MESSQQVPLLKNLSYALFMGASLESKYINSVIALRNKKIVELFSKAIS